MPVLEEVLRSQEGRAAGRRSGIDRDTVVVHPCERGHLKQVLLKLGWPAEDLAGYVDGEAHADRAASRTAGTLRPYQREAVDGFWHGGSGVVVLPCGAGKTIVGAAAMAQAEATTLILVTNTVAARQWKRRAAQAHDADRGRDRRVLRRRARRSGRSRSRRTRC